MLRSAKKASMDESHPFHHYLLGILAFAEVECGNGMHWFCALCALLEQPLTERLFLTSFVVEAAERHGMEGTRRAYEQRDPWAHHAVAHCLEVTGRIDEGIRYVRGLKF